MCEDSAEEEGEALQSLPRATGMVTVLPSLLARVTGAAPQEATSSPKPKPGVWVEMERYVLGMGQSVCIYS